MMTCNQCFYFKANDDKHGQCRINPPQVVPVDGEPLTLFPTVGNGEWCGKWYPIPTPTPERDYISMVNP